VGGVVDDGDFVVAGGDTYLADPAPPRELMSSKPISKPPSNIAILPFYNSPAASSNT